MCLHDDGNPEKMAENYVINILTTCVSVTCQPYYFVFSDVGHMVWGLQVWCLANGIFLTVEWTCAQLETILCSSNSSRSPSSRLTLYRTSFKSIHLNLNLVCRICAFLSRVYSFLMFSLNCSSDPASLFSYGSAFQALMVVWKKEPRNIGVLPFIRVVFNPLLRG